MSFFFTNFSKPKETKMANNKNKRVRKEVRSGQTRVNKAAQLREFLRQDPDLTFAAATAKFEALGLKLASAQFYSIRTEFKKSPAKGKSTRKTTRRKKITPAKPPVVSAKSAPCTADLKTGAEIYGDPALGAEASTQPPNVERTLQARKILHDAYLQAWQVVGQNYDLVDVIVDDIQQQHRAH